MQYKEFAKEMKSAAQSREETLSFLALSQEIPSDVSTFQDTLEALFIEVIPKP